MYEKVQKKNCEMVEFDFVHDYGSHDPSCHSCIGSHKSAWRIHLPNHGRPVL